MKTFFTCLVAVAGFFVESSAQSPQWIWFPEGKPAESTPAGAARSFRKSFEVTGEVAGAKLEITADDHFVAFINGKEIGNDGGGSDGWQTMRSFNAAKAIAPGRNVLAVRATNGGASPAGLVARMTVEFKGGRKISVVTDASWQAALDSPQGWTGAAFDDSKWVAATALGELGKAAPWGDQVAVAGMGKSAAERFKVPDGFVVEAVAEPSGELGSLVAMVFDAKGRLTVSRENGGIQILEDTDKDGKTDRVKVFSDKVKNCQGLLWVNGALYANGNGPEEAGLYRLKDANNDDVADTIETLGKYKGGMGEHGPHAIVLGPDNHLYIALGNHAFVPPDKYAADSPFNRYSEGELLRGYEDPNGHAVGVRSPGGTVCRVDLDGKRWEQFAGGFRNHYDHAFNAEGELFGYDSDMEWDIGLPWYRPTRVNHIIQGGDYGWRSGTAVMPDYFADALPTTVDIGRGSPTGVTFYHGNQFPEKYRGALFIADWSMGRIIAVTLKKNSATYSGTWEPFVTGKPLNVTDLEVGPDGSLYFSTGGRGTQGAVFRVRVEKEAATRGTSRAASASRRPMTTNEAQRVLGDSDPWIRWSARKVLERANPPQWHEKVFAEKNPRPAIEGMIALARVSDGKVLLEKVADKSLALLGQKLSDAELLDLLRVIQVAHIKARGDKGDRKGGYSPLAADAKIAAELSKRFPHADWRINHELARLMVHLDSPDAKNKILAELEKQRSLDAAAPAKADEEKRNQPRENQIHYAYCLGAARDGWTPVQKQRFAAWFEHALKWQGGNSFKGYIEFILRDWRTILSEEENVALLAWHKVPQPKQPKKPAPKPPAETKKFNFDEMAAFIEANKGVAQKGKTHYETRQCARCHKHGDVGQGGLGPDLTAVASRFKRREILEAITDPSKIVSDQFKVFVVKTKSGEQVEGFAAINNAEKVELVQASGERVTIPRNDVASITESKSSLMPAGLLEGLTLAEIADLLAFMEGN